MDKFNSRSILIKGVYNSQAYIDLLSRAYSDLEDIVPSYSEMLLVFNNEITSIDNLISQLKKIMKNEDPSLKSSTLRIPICFHPDFGLDQKRIEKHTKIRFEDIVKRLCDSSFQVGFLGFLPGFAYMKGLDSYFKVPRLESPRLSVPKGSFAIAENQLGIYPTSSPGGWNILGNCPVEVFDVQSDELTLFKPGDQVQFYEISKEEHKQLLNGPLDRKIFEI